MEDQQNKCPVCDSKITGNYCETCGFPVRRVLVPLPDALQEEEQNRISVAKKRWNLFLKKDDEIETLNKEKEKLANDVEEANKKTEEANQQVEEANKTIAARDGQIAQLNADIVSLQNKAKELEEDKKQLEEAKKQIEKDKDDKIGELNARINQLKKELEKRKNNPSPTATPCNAEPIGYLVQQEEDEINSVYPILAGRTIIGKSPAKQENVQTCRIVCSEEKLQDEHFIIDAGIKNGKTPHKAVLNNGEWSINYPENKSPQDIALANETIIIIGDLRLIFIEKVK